MEKQRKVWLHENKVAATCGEQRADKLCRHLGARATADYRVLDALAKEKKITWTKSGRESAKREADLYDMLEKAATDEKR